MEKEIYRILCAKHAKNFNCFNDRPHRQMINVLTTFKLYNRKYVNKL